MHYSKWLTQPLAASAQLMNSEIIAGLISFFLLFFFFNNLPFHKSFYRVHSSKTHNLNLLDNSNQKQKIVRCPNKAPLAMHTHPEDQVKNAKEITNS